MAGPHASRRRLLEQLAASFRTRGETTRHGLPRRLRRTVTAGVIFRAPFPEESHRVSYSPVRSSSPSMMFRFCTAEPPHP